MSKENSILIYPTDTVPGIGAYYLDEDLNAQIDKLKRIDGDKPKSLLFLDRENLNRWIDWPDKISEEWKDRFFSLETTLLVPSERVKCQVPFHINFGGEFLGVRHLAGNEWSNRFSSIEGPVTTTSINLSGTPPLLEIGAIESFLDQYGCSYQVLERDLFDKNRFEKASTIIKMEKDGSFSVVRRGRLVSLVLAQLHGQGNE